MSHSHELMGVPIDRFGVPIILALRAYQEFSDGLEFDSDSASHLVLTPDKTNSARSKTSVVYLGDKVGDLYVIAFKPGDGTGDESSRRIADLVVDHPYPRFPRVVPRDKRGIHTEAHLAIVAHKVDDVHAEPKLYAGSLDELGLRGNRVVKIAELGHDLSEEDLTPLSTLTTGYLESMQRFGDPHAIYNALGQIVVCAFLAISDEVNKAHPTVLSGLNPRLPSRSYRS